jgi:hypothetical protein
LDLGRLDDLLELEAGGPPAGTLRADDVGWGSDRPDLLPGGNILPVTDTEQGPIHHEATTTYLAE